MKVAVTGSFPPAKIPFNLRTRWKDDPNGVVTFSEYEVDAKLLDIQTTIYSEVFNGADHDRVLLLEIQFPGGVPGISAIALPEGYGYAYG